MERETITAAAWGTLFTVVLGALIVLGSRGLEHFDAALVGYTFATLVRDVRHHDDVPACKGMQIRSRHALNARVMC